jgi:galactose mutarotase-like enzyme
MKVLTNNFSVRREQGFAVYVLSNQDTEIAIVPELGAKIISLKSVRTGREWMWHPPGELELFHNSPEDDFSSSPLVGVDECLPTIEPCVWRGRKIPDHGEVWSVGWNVDEEAWQKGILRTSTKLGISPFDFERTIELDEDEVRLSYQLSNRSAVSEYFLWAMHPLLKIQEGDQLVLPRSTRALLNGETWVDAVDSAIPKGNCSKLVAGPLTEGYCGIHNPKTGERFDFEWSPMENNALGLWLTRGGWHGHHHFAIEPTNAGADSLTKAVGREWCGTLAGSSATTWQVRFRIS